ncbi:MAG: TetR family transcriptional regulator [Bacteroidota bacterium]
MIDKREHILNAAEELFAEYGFEGTSVRDLAKKAMVNIAMISYYFGSKEQLMKALIQNRAGSFRQQIETLNKENLSPIDKVDLLIEYWVDRLFSHQKFHRVLNREISLQQRSAFNKTISEIMLGNFEEVKKIIINGQKKKLFRKVDVELTVATLIGTISKVVQSSYLSCKILNVDPDTNSIFSDKHKSRLKRHLKDLMHAHLLIKK